MLLAVNYHYIREEYNTPYPAFFGTTPELFRKQLVELSKHGSFVSADDIAAAVKHEKKLPERSIVITFDDGLREQYEYALPVLNELGIPAIFFVNTINLEQKVSEVHKIHLLRSVISPADFLKEVKFFLNEQNTDVINLDEAENKGKSHYIYDEPAAAGLKYILNFVLGQTLLSSLSDELFKKYFDEKEVNRNLYFSEGQIKELLSKDYLGSHAHEHLPLGKLTITEQNSQVSTSQQKLTYLSGGKTINAFSYPYGSNEACADMDKILESNHFMFSFTMQRGVNTSLNQPYYLHRYDNNDMPLGKSNRFTNKDIFTIH